VIAFLPSRAGLGRPAGRGSARWLVPPVTLLLAAGAAACTADAGPASEGSRGDEQASPFAACDALTVAPSASATVAASAGVTGAASTGAGPAGAADLPDLQLPCFTGGRQIRLTELRGPAVINIWASWCDPCREELPAMQRLADATTGRLHVIGVDSYDSRDAAASFATDEKVTLPTLFDREMRLVAALGRPAVPVTVFIDAAGKRHVYDQVPPDDARLAALVGAHTGVTVKP
jgi:thiol-disulfide isomerase/thioredoxin